MPESNSNIVDVSTLAKFFEVDERTIQNWVSRDGAPRPMERGGYNFLLFVKWRINYLESENKVLKAGGDKKYELEARSIELQNIQRELKIQESLKKLVDVSLVREAFVSDAIAYKNGLENLEYKLKIKLEGVNDESKKAVIIRNEINDIRKEIGSELTLNEKEENIIDDLEIEAPGLDNNIK